MIAYLRKIFSPPETILDAEKTRIAAFLNTILLLSAIVIPFQQIFVLTADPFERRLLVTMSWLVMVVIARIVLQRGLVKTAGAGFLAVFWLWITIQNTTAGGVTAPAFAAQVVFVFAAGILLGGWGALVAGLMAISTALVFLVLERKGLLPVPMVQNTPLRYFITYVTILIMTVPVVWLALRSKQAAMQFALDSEEKWHSTEANYRRFIEGLRVDYFMYRHDAAGIFTYISPSIANVLGYSQDEFCCHSSKYLTDSPINRDVSRHTGLSLQGVQQPPYAIEVLHKDGRPRLLEMLENPVFDEKGAVVAVEGIAHDVTERKRMEEQLRDSQRRLADIIEFLPDATLVIDAEGRVTAWNLAIENMTGVKSENMIGKGNYEYALPFYGTRRPILIDLVTKSPDEIKEKYSYLRQYNGFLAGEAYVPVLRGEEAYLTATAAVLRDDRGRVAGAIECIRDITERKRAGEALRESGDRLRTITDTAKDAIIMIDNNGKVSFWNPAAQATFGYAAGEVLGQDFHALLTPERFRSAYRRGFVSFQKTGRAPVLGKTSELIALRKDGTEFPAEISLSAIKIKDTWHAVVMLRDISARKQAEQDLQNAKDAAEAANRAKSAFLAMMSHEIRTPMNAIIGMSGLLLDGDLAPPQRDFAQTIRTSGEALLSIINDILDFSKIEAGRLSLEIRPFDLRQCMESSLDLFAHRARSKGLELGCLIDSHTPTAVVGDSNRLQQILVNLIGNAIKFTEKGEVVVIVNASRLDAQSLTENLVGTSIPAADREDRWFELQFSVRDTGIGIPAERMNRLFQAFSQADLSTARKYGGTGLGLAICKRLTEMMGGRIWAESEVGKGSAFYFTICARAEAGARPVYLAVDQPTLHGKRVLIVDDNSTNREILSRQVASWGMEPVAEATGMEALEILQRGDSFHLIVLDMQMPEMDGLTLSERILTLPGGQSVPLVMLSSSPEELEPAHKQRFRAVLLKPVKASRLYDALLEIFCPAGAAITSSATEEETTPFDPAMGKRHPLRILLAEDNAGNQKLALAILERLGYRADIAGNGMEVLEALTRQSYDVVLMDVQMPEMDGLEATREIRACVATERQPRIVALTADAMEEDRRQCFAAGMDDYVSKPILVPDLVAALSRSPAKTNAVASSTSEAAGAHSKDPNHPVPAPATRKLEPVSGELQSGMEILDRNALERVKKTLGKQAEAMFPVLLQSFLVDSVRFFADAHRALQETNAPDLRRAAHSLKSHAATFGAMALSAVALQLEQLAREGIFTGAAELIIRAEQEFVKVRTALRQDGE